MTSAVTLPLWLFVLLCALALWSALDRLLIPSVRWYLRRRLNRVIDEVNARLQLRIQPFKLTKRQVLIDRLMYDPEVVAAAERHAERNGMRREEVMAEVARFAHEIVPAFNAYAYFRVGYWIAKTFARMLYRVRLGYADHDGLSAVPPGASVVFIMNHRSNLDYILVTYLVADRSALSYAVGEWARVWPLQTLIRSLGAYFIRRDSDNPLYRRVLARYVHMATRAGVVQAVYPEGGLTRDGRLRPPRLGLLAYMIGGFDPGGERDLVFVPVGINYDRVLEDRSQVAKTGGGGRRPAAVAATVLRFVAHQLGLALRGRWFRFGYAGVGFGTPISMRAYLAERDLDLAALDEGSRFAEVQRLAEHLMDATGRMVPVLPVSLVATVFVQAAGALGELELKARAQHLMETLEAAGAHVHIPRADRDYAVAVGLRMLTLRHLVETRDGLYAARPEERSLLLYYANAIAHLLRTPLGVPGGVAGTPDIRSRA